MFTFLHFGDFSDVRRFLVAPLSCEFFKIWLSLAACWKNVRQTYDFGKNVNMLYRLNWSISISLKMICLRSYISSSCECLRDSSSC